MPSVRTMLTALTLLVVVATPAVAQSGSFGNALVVGDGELLIAEPNNTFRPGIVYVYRRSGGVWQEAAQLRAPDAERSDGFGSALARAGNTLFVAQVGGRIHVFERTGGSWNAAGLLEPNGLTGFDRGCNYNGYCSTDLGITLAAQGDWLLVGDPGQAGGGGRGGRGGDVQQARSGLVHVFQRAADGTWTSRVQLRGSGAAPGDGFGKAIALSNDRVLIGSPSWTAPAVAPDSAPEAGRGGRGGRGRGGPPAPSNTEPINATGRVYEFVLENGAWRETGPLSFRSEANANFGAAVAFDGSRAVIGAPGSAEGHGAAFLFERNESGVLQERARLTGFSSVRGDEFGSAVAMDGDAIMVGAPADRGIENGMVYVYRGVDDTGVASVRRIRRADTDAEDLFGFRIAADGGVAAVNASGADHLAGIVFVYERGSSGEWQEAGKLVSEPDYPQALLGEERACTDGAVDVFECSDVELLAYIPGNLLRAGDDSRGVRVNDNWGWTDPETNREYALIGRNDGTSFIDITDPSNPVLIGDLPKTPGTARSPLWRDIKTYRDHAFIVADGAPNHGMQVFDLARLRNVQNPPALFEPDVLYTGIQGAEVSDVHNIAINEETGFAYLTSSCGGLHMVDIRDPKNPQFAGCSDPGGTHDMECIIYHGPDTRYTDHEICLRSGGGEFIVSDLTDKENPVTLGRTSHPNPAYMHQGWTTPDHRYHFMDDESDVIRGNVPTTRTLIWDLTDLQDPLLAKEFMGSMTASAHNLYLKDGLMYQANYRYGLHILDITDPLDPKEVGFFDTSPYQTGPGFGGAWSNYPFFDSGTIIVTSMQEGLFVLRKRRVVF